MDMYQKEKKKKGTKGSTYEQGINSKISVFFTLQLILPPPPHPPSFKSALK